uniref:ATP synthase F0 subunit b n=1 Tax=Seculamonas ecuadoriensis TaxID=221724 RepID=Q85IH5_SECEC|nr:ATP synthase F0 subunit b [Seculamonas ecuadoriensis]AAO45019.1 ATP synthase F0 subunit b [Seculamonas ecuadoriensis]AGH24469.1 ATP synthase F0 subunit b [Seculamonas ecuadoriensis]
MASFFKNGDALLVLLVFSVAGFVSKEILVLNAEALVALCFILFVIFIYVTAKDVIVAELKDRASQIQKEFDDSYLLKEELYETLMGYHKKQVSLLEEINEIFMFSKEQIEKIISTRKEALKYKISNEIENKLKTIAIKEQALLRYMQLETNRYITEQILTEAADTSSELNQKAIQEGIEMIERVASQQTR